MVKAVRVDGKPRHKFVLGLGSQKNYDKRHIMWFWYYAIRRMKRHGLTEAQRYRIAAEWVRKGARSPNRRTGSRGRRGWPYMKPVVAEMVVIIEAQVD